MDWKRQSANIADATSVIRPDIVFTLEACHVSQWRIQGKSK